MVGMLIYVCTFCLVPSESIVFRVFLYLNVWSVWCGYVVSQNTKGFSHSLDSLSQSLTDLRGVCHGPVNFCFVFSGSSRSRQTFGLHVIPDVALGRLLDRKHCAWARLHLEKSPKSCWMMPGLTTGLASYFVCFLKLLTQP